jgi:threonine dehydratase
VKNPTELNWTRLAREARVRSAPYLPGATPLIYSHVLSKKTGRNVYLKLESRQPTGAYKVRPALNGILSHLDAARARGVLTTSSGNFAQATAWAARELGVNACIVMTDDTAPYKIERTRALGAEVVFCGTTFESRFETVGRLEKERGSLVLHGFDSEETIAADGTIALELIEQLGADTPFTVISPASGGGMIAGIASTLRQQDPDRYQVVGYQPEQGGAIAKSLRAGGRLNVGKVHTIADALVASIPGERTFQLIQKYCPEFGLIPEDAIRFALRFAIEEEKIWAEPGGVVSVAGLLSQQVALKHPTVVCIISGGNLDPGKLDAILSANKVP